MPNTLDPNRVLDSFLDGLATQAIRFEKTYRAVVSGGNELGLRKGLASDYAFRLGGEWELFQHRWHVAAISKSPSVFRKRIQDEVDAALLKNATFKMHLEVIEARSFEVPQWPSAPQIEKFLDPLGYNISFDSGETWIRKAKADLSPTHWKKVEAIVTTPEDSCVLDAIKAIRNRIAHGSDGSRTRLNTFVRARPATSNEGLVGAINNPLLRVSNEVRDVATYLHGGYGTPSKLRVAWLSDRIGAVAGRLRV